MRKKHQLQILELLETIKEAQAASLYADCQDGAVAIAEFIDDIKGEGMHTAALLEEYCHLVYQAHIGEIGKNPLRKQLYKIENSVKTELKPNKYKALFLPYYDNTWESMKSVYEIFSHDPLFETEVVIIPIVRNTNTGRKFVWEDYLTPKGIPNTHYDLYDFEADLPDIVFYNQPYDGVNIPKFYSKNIRKYTNYMVYIPYSVKPINVQGERYQKAYTELEAIQRCDLFITQSEAFRKHYLTGTPLYKKALVHGHPKCDSLYDAKANNKFKHYPEWEMAIGNRRVIVLNTHYSYMLNDIAVHPGVKRLIDVIAEKDDLFLIWRPHPQAFLMKMSPQMQSMLDFANIHERMIIDRTPSMTPAYMYANAVVSLFPSTIVMDALFLDLPVFVLGRNDTSTPSHCAQNPFYKAITHEDFSQLPPAKGADSETVRLYIERSIYEPLDTFIWEVQNGKDSKREGRAAFRIQEFPNMDGTVAEKILKSVKGRLERNAQK